MSLPAVILVGGQGTRLRPLTDTTRKDMLPLVDRPLLAYTFEHLARHGVERAVVSCGYLPDQIAATFATATAGSRSSTRSSRRRSARAGGSRSLLAASRGASSR